MMRRTPFIGYKPPRKKLRLLLVLRLVNIDGFPVLGAILLVHQIKNLLILDFVVTDSSALVQHGVTVEKTSSRRSNTIDLGNLLLQVGDRLGGLGVEENSLLVTLYANIHGHL
eukprot:Mycagemm_TRINITY_DN10311_c0_g1::TRINITY_DN10311_c0_g1_i1::g.1216::m.1216 type:complete len:113 gc:universal TRINITY_DN10311_c0_g1_i1:392-54(-)